VVNRPALNPLAGTSVFVGSLTEIVGSFQGTAIMQSDQPLLATLVQIPQGGIVLNRPLSNGFTAGTSTSLLATVIKNTFDANTVFSVQNVGGVDTTATVKFFNTSAVEVHSLTQLLKPGAGFYVDTGIIPELGTSFNGSSSITASAGGSLISSAMEMSIAGNGVSAFEGVGQGSSVIYMPTALCNAFGGAFNTSYAVQNTSNTTSTNVTVTFSNGTTLTKTIGPLSKQSFPACSAVGMTSGFSGSARINSTATPVIAVGKAYGAGLSTAFLGIAQGAPKLYLPYVRWATDVDYAAGTEQRTFIAIQNIGTSDIAAGQVTAKYVDRNGTVLATHVLGAINIGDKVNSNAGLAGLSEFGIYHPGYGGSVIIEGPVGSQLAAIGRVQTTVVGGTVGEDYNAIAP
jgi:hypothetical protein